MPEENSDFNTVSSPQDRLSKRMQRAIDRRTKKWKKVLAGRPWFDTKSREKVRSKHSRGRTLIRDMYHHGDWPGTKHPEISTQTCPTCDSRRTFINGECGTCHQRAPQSQ